MDKQEIKKMFAVAVKARLEKSMALGTKATWSMADHLDVATKVIYKAGDAFKGEDAHDLPILREVIQATYNHSAFAQKLEKDFSATGHFQREAKVSRQVPGDDPIAQLAAEITAAAKKG